MKLTMKTIDRYIDTVDTPRDLPAFFSCLIELTRHDSPNQYLNYCDVMHYLNTGRLSYEIETAITKDLRNFCKVLNRMKNSSTNAMGLYIHKTYNPDGVPYDVYA